MVGCQRFLIDRLRRPELAARQPRSHRTVKATPRGALLAGASRTHTPLRTHTRLVKRCHPARISSSAHSLTVRPAGSWGAWSWAAICALNASRRRDLFCRGWGVELGRRAPAFPNHLSIVGRAALIPCSLRYHCWICGAVRQGLLAQQAGLHRDPSFPPPPRRLLLELLLQ